MFDPDEFFFHLAIVFEQVTVTQVEIYVSIDVLLKKGIDISFIVAPFLV